MRITGQSEQIYRYLKDRPGKLIHTNEIASALGLPNGGVTSCVSKLAKEPRLNIKRPVDSSLWGRVCYCENDTAEDGTPVKSGILHEFASRPNRKSNAVAVVTATEPGAEDYREKYYQQLEENIRLLKMLLAEKMK